MSWPIRTALLWKVLVLGLAAVAHSENPDTTIARLAHDLDTHHVCMRQALDALRLERARTRCAVCGPADPRLGRMDADASPTTTAAIACLEALLIPPPPPR